MTIHADAALHVGRFDGDERTSFNVADGRLAYVHVARGSVVAGGIRLEAGDALKVRDAGDVTIESGRDAEVLLFDLAA